MGGKLWWWIPPFFTHKAAVNLQTRVPSPARSSTSLLRMSDPRIRLSVSLFEFIQYIVMFLGYFCFCLFLNIPLLQVYHYGRFLNSKGENLERGAQVFLSVDEDRRRLNSRYEFSAFIM